MIHDATNLSVASLTQRDEESRSLTISLEHDEIAFGGSCRFAGPSIDEVETTLDLLDRLLVQSTTDRHVVALVHAVSRVRQAIRQLAVVGEQQQAGALEIEPANREQPRAGRMPDKIDRQLPSLGILRGADVALRFEEHDVVIATSLLHPPTIDPDIVVLRIDEARKPVDDPPIQRHRPLFDQSLAGSTRGDTGVRQHALNADSTRFRCFLSVAGARHSDHSTVMAGPIPDPGGTPDMLRSIRQAIEWLRLAVTEPIGQLTAMQASIRRWFEVLRYCVRHLGEDQAPVLAAALAFRVLFGLVPMLVVVTVVSRSVLQDQFPAFVGSIIDRLGLGSVSLSANTDGAASNLGTWMQDLVASASHVNLAALGWVGFGVVIYSALWVLVTIEDGFNRIYRAPSGRSWLRRLLVYWFLLTFPAALGGVLPYFTGGVSAFKDQMPDWAWLDTTIDIGAAGIFTWLLLLMAYLWVPNTRVEVKPAMAGALVAAILIEGAKHLLGVYTTHALTLNKLYGSLGLIPLFMFWMYLMWVFVLFGLEVSSIIQTLRGRAVGVLASGDTNTRLVAPSIGIQVIQKVADGFDAGRPTNQDELTNDLGLDPELARRLVDRLARAGFLSRLDPPDRITLARPAASINLEEVLRIGFEIADGPAGAADPIVERLRKAQESALEGVRLTMKPDSWPGKTTPAPPR